MTTPQPDGFRYVAPMLNALRQVCIAIGRSFIIASGVLTALYFWPDWRDLPDAYGYEWGHFMPRRETALFIALFLALAWVVWMDARPSVKAYFGRKAPLRIEPASGSRGPIGVHFVSVTNTSSADVENVSIYLKGIHHAGIVRSPLRPGDEGYLLFDGDKETVSLRPGETAFAPYMKDVVVGGEEVEFGPFRSGGRSRGGKQKYKALVIEFIAYSKAFPPRHQSIWIRREPAENGGKYTSGLDRPSYADLGYPKDIQALEKKRRRELPSR